MRAANDNTAGRQRLHAAIVISAVILLFSILVCAWYVLLRGYAVPLDLESYTTIGRDAENRPTATLDIDAVLRDLGLPDPTSPEVQTSRYPDVAALCSMEVIPRYADTDGYLHVTIVADTPTLLFHGIRLVKTEWEQALPPASPELWTEAEQGEPEELEEGTPPVMEEGTLVSLLDRNENGLNLRGVCERVHKERDAAAVEAFGEEYSATKLSVTFFSDANSVPPRNVYRALYRISERTDDGQTPDTVYLTVDVMGLKWSAASGVTFASVETETYETQEEATALTADMERQYAVVKLSGGGVMVEDKGTFDQNGFVRFAEQPTSFLMPNGLYWSPTYDALTEDMIWKLTATEERSMVNLLRYARREIYARHGAAFDETTEKEFYDFYHRYAWYHGGSASVDDLLTEEEKSNVRLLREIQSLLEN